ncbi:mitochondrial carrier protein, carnitine/acylcarnitine translocase [Rhodotorula toruloides]|uniref:Mitochondrial carrier protein, carnitine/acylcarnitine translocase n=1 Tax=Rhodotorula toruloides TaxID=5286 RepID=A0A511KJN4_RHOTO|nr:mitochondrial carrier protein, carnitine/acylcarnitine translocase [Rhodotorula toruloides]
MQSQTASEPGDSSSSPHPRSAGSSPSPAAASDETWREFTYENRNTIAAITASFCSTVAGFPLDSVKSRLQVKRYSSVLDCARRTYAEEGIRGFFRGVTIPLVTITLVRTASFSIYTWTKGDLQRRNLLTGETVGSTALAGFLGGAASGLLLSVGTTAFEYTKIKLQLEYLIAMKKGVPYVPRGTIKGFLDLYRAGGVFGLYTGFRLHALRDTLGTGLYFGMYDSAQHVIWNNPDVFENVPTTLSTFVCGSVAGVSSWAAIYPVDLVKAHTQRNALADLAYESPVSIFKRLSAGGVTKLYRGLGVSAGRSVFTHGLMWTILEKTRSAIARRAGPQENDAKIE